MASGTSVKDPAALDGLVSPFGVVSSVRGSGGLWRNPSPIVAYGSSAGSGFPGRGARVADHVTCGGRSWDSPEAARFIAIAEGAERYAAMDGLGEERIWATAGELAGECLEPHRYPRCSADELANPRCPISPFDPEAPIRWVRGLDLVTGESTWVPAIMACYRLHDITPQERFTYPISTGYAVHTDPVQAVIGGICEVIERDAISVVWLQRLALPTMDPSAFTEEVVSLIEWNRRRFVGTHIFDATSDLGVPTAYCVLSADHDPLVHRVIGVATGSTQARAIEKSLFETIGMFALLHEVEGEIPGSVDRFAAIEDGARFMAVAERSSAFDFLLTPGRPPQAMAAPCLSNDPHLALAQLIEALADAGARPVVVDRTPHELADVGLTAVSVVIPDLQPMSLHPLAQFKAHPRLYEAPRRMGHRVLSEKELNPWPQPFA